jgi:hypothetical protein
VFDVKNNTIIRAIGGIDDELIERAAPQPKAELNGTESPEQKRRPVRFIPLLAAVIALLSFATIAAANHFNVFDRLREIVGGEMAETLQQVEIDEEKRIVTDAGAGFSFEFVAVGVLSNVVDVYLIIEDLEGNRLDETVEVFGDVTVLGEGARFPIAIIDGEEFIAGEQLPTAPSTSEVISLTDDGVLTLRNRFVFDRPITEQDLVFNLRAMQYNLNYFAELNSSFAFSIEIPAYQDELVTEELELNVRFYDHYISRETTITFTEARLSPISLTLVGFEEHFENEPSTFFERDVKIRMIDGTITNTRPGWGYIGVIDGFIVFTTHLEIDVAGLLDLRQVYAIEIAGESITFD